MMARVIIRADASSDIGSGHVMRCHALADVLRRQGTEVLFICREWPGHYCDWLESQGFIVSRLPPPSGAPQLSDLVGRNSLGVSLDEEIRQCHEVLRIAGRIDWLIVDHYGIDHTWERAMRSFCQKTMVIDDLANRVHDCDILLDQNLQSSPNRYQDLVPASCEMLLGPKYALLRREFAEQRVTQRVRDRIAERILVNMGGSDPQNLTKFALDALVRLGLGKLTVDVVVGQANPNIAELTRLCANELRIKLHVQSGEMAKLMARADFMIGAAGSTLWERCCLGLSGIVLCIAENQQEASRLAARQRVAFCLDHANLDADEFSRFVSSLLQHPSLLNRMSRRAARLVDGRGCERVSGSLLGMSTLITSASRKVPLLQVVREAQKKFGARQGQIHVGDSDAACIARYFADKFWLMPKLEEITPDMLVEHCLAEGIRFVIPTRDGELAFWAAVQEQLGRQGVAVMVSKTESVKLCLDKLEFARFAFAMGFPAIQTANKVSEIEGPRFVVKERYGAGSLNVALNVDHDEAEAYAQRLENPIFQPFVPGLEYSVDVYVNRKGRCMGAVARRREVVSRGESQVTTTLSHPRLESMCSELAEALNLYGHAVFQAIEDNTGHLHIIECNPRFGGASTLSVHSGLDSFVWFFCESSGGVLGLHPFERNEVQLRQIRYPCDAIFTTD